MKPCVYILASRRGGFLYIGVTADIRRRLQQHQDGQVQHTRKYRIRRPVYLEPHQRITDAIQREKQLKFWKRAWKIRLIEDANPLWNDLARQLAWFD
jgi:putative endonuclease